MGNVINLNRFRKRAERQATAKQADANRTKFGRTKAERSAEEFDRLVRPEKMTSPG